MTEKFAISKDTFFNTTTMCGNDWGIEFDEIYIEEAESMVSEINRLIDVENSINTKIEYQKSKHLEYKKKIELAILNPVDLHEIARIQYWVTQVEIHDRIIKELEELL